MAGFYERKWSSAALWCERLAMLCIPYFALTIGLHRFGKISSLQAAWRRLERQPLLVVLVGSDISMMEALSTYGRPPYGRLRELVVPPFSPAETADQIGLAPAEALDAHLVLGGMPRLAALWRQGDDLWSFLARQLDDATSPLIVLGERSLNAEFPADLKVRDVLSAIGAGARAYSAILHRAGVKQTQLNHSLETLVAKRVVDKLVPYCARAGASRNTRYLVHDPYLRFWLRFLGPGIELAARGRGSIVVDRIRESWTSYRGLRSSRSFVPRSNGSSPTPASEPHGSSAATGHAITGSRSISSAEPTGIERTRWSSSARSSGGRLRASTVPTWPA